MKILKYKHIKSPVGSLKIVVEENSLVAILWDNQKLNPLKLTQMVENKDNPLILETEKQLEEYFLYSRKSFDLPLQTSGTIFQEEVWKLLKEISYGSTCFYKEIALKMNHPQAIRATGTAIGRNPISIIIPCHRVIASNGKLAGFAGGLDRKKFLLDLESH